MKVAKSKDQPMRRKLKTIGEKKELKERLRAAVALEIEHGKGKEDEEEVRKVSETGVEVDSSTFQNSETSKDP